MGRGSNQPAPPVKPGFTLPRGDSTPAMDTKLPLGLTGIVDAPEESRMSQAKMRADGGAAPFARRAAGA